MASSTIVDALKRIQRKSKAIERFEFQSDLDSGGDPAVWVWVVFKTDASEDAWAWENRERLRSTIRDELKKVGVTDWVYVRFRSAEEESPSAFVSST